jgi:hypothetical protein
MYQSDSSSQAASPGLSFLDDEKQREDWNAGGDQE